VKDSNEAIRFSRKEDAEGFITMFDVFLLNPVATEHEWPANTHPSPTDADAPEGLAGELEQAVEVHRGHCVNYVSFDFGLADRILTALRRPTADADGLALLRDIRDELPQVCMLIDSIRQEWEPGGDWSEWDQGRRSALTGFMHRIDAHLKGPDQ
jgi:hypothetical protein